MGDERERVLGVGAEGDINDPGATAGEGGGSIQFGGKRGEQSPEQDAADRQEADLGGNQAPEGQR